MQIFRLKKEWFNKIKKGEKVHEYRISSKYWESRLNPNMIFNIHTASYENKLNPNRKGVKIGDRICFTLGYPRTEETSKFLYAEVLNIYEDVDGKETDLKIDEPVFDIEFRLIEE